MNIIFTYKATAPFSKEEQANIDKKAIYSQIPEMFVKDEFDIDGILIAKTIPYQANVDSQADFDELKLLLEAKGVVKIIGKWNDDGSKISLNKTKFVALRKPKPNWHKVTYLNNIKEADYVPKPLLDENGKEQLDLDGNVIMEVPNRKVMTELLSEVQPTATTLADFPVNIFGNKFKREV